MLNLRQFWLLPITLGLTLVITACYNQGEAASSPVSKSQLAKSDAGLQVAALMIKSGGKTHNFNVEVAKSGEEQAQGLMFRTQLAPDAGMIFPMKPARMASFWMKNTVIPLDIIFIRPDGTIESVAANTTPYSLDPVPSGEPVAAVLELAGGRAAQLGISAGDKVEWTQ